MKDPAALMFIDKWLTSTKEMKADERGWYLNLILHQYDKGDLPNDIEELANLCDVRISEYDQFKQKWEQVLKHKFKVNDKQRLENGFASEILRKRELFKEKRTLSGKIGYVIKFAKANFKVNAKVLDYLKSNIDFDNLDTKDEQMLKQVLKQKIKLYINVNEDVIKDIPEEVTESIAYTEEFLTFWEKYPRKESKDYAFACWQKKKGKPKLDVILQKLALQVVSQDWLADGGKFIPQPSKYINQGMWHNEIRKPKKLPTW